MKKRIYRNAPVIRKTEWYLDNRANPMVKPEKSRNKREVFDKLLSGRDFNRNKRLNNQNKTCGVSGIMKVPEIIKQ